MKRQALNVKEKGLEWCAGRTHPGRLYSKEADRKVIFSGRKGYNFAIAREYTCLRSQPQAIL
jgi:hypothetical protein